MDETLGQRIGAQIVGSQMRARTAHLRAAKLHAIGTSRRLQKRVARGHRRICTYQSRLSVPARYDRNVHFADTE
jgi:hypothetical protein